jgi:hypothetical protein
METRRFWRWSWVVGFAARLIANKMGARDRGLALSFPEKSQRFQAALLQFQRPFDSPLHEGAMAETEALVENSCRIQ